MFENPWDNDNNEPDSTNDKVKSSYLKKKKEKFINLIKNSGSNKRDRGSLTLLYVIAVCLLFLWLSTGFFIVDTDEGGVVIRFGEYNREAKPGLNYKLPAPFETVEKVSVTRIKKDIIGKITRPIGYSRSRYLGGDSGLSENDLSYTKESQMLTGDENIIDMHFYIQWRISNPKDYLFNIKDDKNNNIVRNVAESIMRKAVGSVTLSEALSEKRLVIEEKVEKELQGVLDLYGAGIEVISVGILYSYVGPEVRDAYRDVQSAKADRERFINQAQAYNNEIIPKAKGDAKAAIERALAYKESVIAKAKGDAQKFDEIYKSYSVNKDITKKRMYLDTMEKIYQDTNKIIIDKEVSKGVLPFLPLSKIHNEQN